MIHSSGNNDRGAKDKERRAGERAAARFSGREARRGSSANLALKDGVRHGFLFYASLPAPMDSLTPEPKGLYRSPGTVRARDRRPTNIHSFEDKGNLVPSPLVYISTVPKGSSA